MWVRGCAACTPWPTTTIGEYLAAFCSSASPTAQVGLNLIPHLMHHAHSSFRRRLPRPPLLDKPLKRCIRVRPLNSCNRTALKTTPELFTWVCCRIAAPGAGTRVPRALALFCALAQFVQWLRAHGFYVDVQHAQLHHRQTNTRLNVYEHAETYRDKDIQTIVAPARQSWLSHTDLG